MKVLIVDDEEDILTNIASVLEPTNYYIKTTVNPLEALDFLRKEQFDIVVTDYKMPEMDGIRLLKEINKLYPKTKVIIITAYGDITTAISAINNHAYAFFSKPIDFSEFIHMMRNVEKENEEKNENEKDYERLNKENESLKWICQKLLDQVNNLEKNINGSASTEE